LEDICRSPGVSDVEDCVMEPVVTDETEDDEVLGLMARMSSRLTSAIVVEEEVFT
jgi:hypothetical protein